MNDGRAADAEPALLNQAAAHLGPTGFDPAREEVWAACATVLQSNGERKIFLAGGKSEAHARGVIMQSVASGSTIEGHIALMIAYRDSDASLAEDPKGLSGEAVAARAEGIARKPIP